MIKLKCTCGVLTNFHNWDVTLPKKAGQVAFSEFNCPVCGKKIAVLAVDADKNSINVESKIEEKEETQ